MSDDANDMKQMLKQQLKLMELLSNRLSGTTLGHIGDSLSVDQAASSITEFLFDPQANVTFDAWYSRYEDLFGVDFAKQDDA